MVGCTVTRAFRNCIKLCLKDPRVRTQQVNTKLPIQLVRSTCTCSHVELQYMDILQ